MTDLPVRVVLLAMTDGRDDYLVRSLPAAYNRLQGCVIDRLVIHDDTGDEEHSARLRTEYPTATVINPGCRLGFGGAIANAWQYLAATPEAGDYVFHLEDDFIIERDVDVAGMAWVLDALPRVAQVALRRQPWSADEIAAGGVVEVMPDAYRERSGTRLWPTIDEYHWLEHTLFWTTNPSLYHRSRCISGWPDGDQSEGHYTIRLREEGQRFAYWGRRDDPPYVTHIGARRAGKGY